MNPYLLGLDVSKWQSSVGWAYAKTQGVQYAFVKAQEWYFTDPQFLNHWSGSLAAGVLRGAYLYYRDALVPEMQAQKFHELLASTGDMGELPPVLDIETYNNPTLTPSKIKKCLETMAALFGRAPIFYSRNDVVQTIGNPSWLLAYPLWLAQYTLIGWQTDHFEKVKQYPPTIPPPYPFYWVWQFSDKCPAITFQVTGSATVDTNYAPEEIINAWAGQLPPPDPEPIGEPTLKFITKFVLNVRSGADTTFPIVGSLPVNTVVSALQIQPTDSNSVWLEFETGKWVAMVHNGGGPYLAFHSATEGEPMTPEQLARLEAVESLTAEHTEDILTLQQSQVDVFEATHKLVTTKPGGEKLRAWPGGSEAVQIYNNAMLMDLEQTRGGQKLMAYVQEGVIITGFLDPIVLLEL